MRMLKGNRLSEINFNGINSDKLYFVIEESIVVRCVYYMVIDFFVQPQIELHSRVFVLILNKKCSYTVHVST